MDAGKQCARDHEDDHSRKRRLRLCLALPGRLGEGLAAILDILRDALQSLARGLRSRSDLLYVGKGIGIVGLLAKFFKKRMNFGEDKKHFAAAPGL
jgi:hypothetical protein